MTECWRLQHRHRNVRCFCSKPIHDPLLARLKIVPTCGTLAHHLPLPFRLQELPGKLTQLTFTQLILAHRQAKFTEPLGGAHSVLYGGAVTVSPREILWNWNVCRNIMMHIKAETGWIGNTLNWTVSIVCALFEPKVALSCSPVINVM